MKPERGYFSTDAKGDVHWVASEEGIWLLCPEKGLRQMTDSDVIIGIDKEITDRNDWKHI